MPVRTNHITISGLHLANSSATSLRLISSYAVYKANIEDLKRLVSISFLKESVSKHLSESDSRRSFETFTSLYPTSFNREVVSWLYPQHSQTLMQKSLEDERSNLFKEVVVSMFSSSCKGMILEFDSKFAITTNLLRLEGYNTLAFEKEMSNVRAAHVAGMQNILHGDHTDLVRVLNRYGNLQVCAAVKYIHDENIDDLSDFLDELSKFQKSGDKLMLPIVIKNGKQDKKTSELLNSRLEFLTSLLKAKGYSLNQSCNSNSNRQSRLNCALYALNKRWKAFFSQKTRTFETLFISDSSLLIAEKE